MKWNRSFVSLGNDQFHIDNVKFKVIYSIQSEHTYYYLCHGSMRYAEYEV